MNKVGLVSCDKLCENCFDDRHSLCSRPFACKHVIDRGFINAH